MQAELSFIDLFLGASLVVQLVMIILFVLAGTSWWFIFDKWLTLSRARKDIYEFETDFWNSKNIEKTFNELNRKEDNFGLSQIFVISHEEFLKAENFEKAEDRINKSTEIIINRQEERLEEGLSFLSTVASVSPFIGLFGTVWGIMNSFQSIAISRNTSLAIVAPGIAEALFATALGLLAAIPAVVAYNKFNSDSRRYFSKIDNFSKRFLSII